ncbi:MAG: DUF3298 and DUF4163 domain-containing protein [Lachnospiraceae bacterium]|nr:DUF3298 and DUF4163 domain-containing protein [Lachnospiraceae bacterium]
MLRKSSAIHMSCLAALAASLLIACSGTDSAATFEAPADTESVSSDDVSSKPASEDNEKQHKGTIPMTCTNTYTSMKRSDYEATTGIIYSFTLDGESAKEYPELAAKIDEINEEAYSDFVESMESATAQSLQRHMDGWGYPYEEDRTAAITRADERAFSYYVCNFSYLGGAHGYTDFSAEAIDSVTGEDIEFRDVVKDVSDFPQIVFDELVRQCPDMEGYFDGLSTDKENLLARIKEDASSDGPVWSLGYDGITVYFEDYAMGSYAAGAQIVEIPYSSHSEIFDEKYFTYDGDVPDAASHVNTKEEDAKLPLVSENTIMQVGFDREFKFEDKAPYSLGNADKYIIGDDYPELKKKVDALNEADAAKLENAFGDFCKTADKDYEAYKQKEGDDFHGLCEYGLYKYLSRADDKAFSYASAISRIGIAKNERTIVGVNIDPKTGKDLALDDVVTDIYYLEDAIEEVLEDEGYPDATTKMASDELHKQISSKNLISNEKLSWTIGYDGLTIYCNNTVNFTLMDFGADAVPIFIPYNLHDDLFVEGFSDVPKCYAYQIPVSGAFGTSVKLDTEFNGKYTDINIYPSMNEYGEIDVLTFGINGFLNRVENFYSSDLLMTVVKDPMGDSLIYTQCAVDDGGLYMRVFDLSYGNLNEVTEEDDYPDQQVVYYATETRSGHVMTDPLDFYVFQVDYTLGYRDTYARCCISSLGIPKPIDGKWMYGKDNHMYDIAAATDIKTDAGTIRKGEIFTPVSIEPEAENAYYEDESDDRKIKKSTLMLNGKSGKKFKLELESTNGYEWTYNGTDVKKLFDGFFNYPG